LLTCAAAAVDIDMSLKTRKITFSALMTALSIVFLWLASVFPTGQLGFVAVASLFSVAVVIEAGIASSVLVFICCAVLSLLLIPMKGAALLYLLFFGYYPIIKSFAERMHNRYISLLFKSLVFIAALCVLWFLFRSFVFTGAIAGLSPFLIIPAGYIVFLIYDFGLSKLIGYYIYRISPKFKRK